ncbi:MAG: DUF4302 domain-containing protein [Flavobacteriaceae bacterium]|nr:DUF4302 domain-containing protein [Flavobacteriaceae bacterium]
MKKIINILWVIMLVVAVSCSQETEDLFDKTASERIQASMEKYKEILQSSENGWAFEYYCGGKDKEMGGFMLPLIFKEDKVIATMDMYLMFGTPLQYADTTNYSLNENGGLTLSFDEYNNNIHFFADPNTFGRKPDGLKGDFEFLLTGYEDDIIYLKGKKYGLPLRMKKIEKSYVEYLEGLTKVMNVAIKWGDYAYKQFDVNEEMIMFEKDNRNIICKTEDKDGKEKESKLPYVFTDNGISFFEPVTIKGVTFQHLNVDVENKCFKSADGKVALYTEFQIPFDIIDKSWVVRATDEKLASKLFRETYSQVNTENTKKYPDEKLKDYLKVGKTPQGPVGIVFASEYISNSKKGHIASFETTVGINKKKELSLTLNGYGSKTEPYKHLKPLADLIAENSPYRYELDKPKYPKAVKLISVKNADVWFTLQYK